MGTWGRGRTWCRRSLDTQAVGQGKGRAARRWRGRSKHVETVGRRSARQAETVATPSASISWIRGRRRGAVFHQDTVALASSIQRSAGQGDDTEPEGVDEFHAWMKHSKSTGLRDEAGCLKVIGALVRPARPRRWSAPPPGCASGFSGRP